MKLALKIDIHGRTPALIGAPCLADLLEAQAAGGTFMFSVGPDRSGTHIGRFFRRGMPASFLAHPAHTPFLDRFGAIRDLAAGARPWRN